MNTIYFEAASSRAARAASFAVTSGAQRRQHRVTSPTSVAQRACSRGSGRGGAPPKARNVASGGYLAHIANRSAANYGIQVSLFLSMLPNLVPKTIISSLFLFKSCSI